MGKITERARKILRKFFMFAGAGAVSLLFQACYGPVMGDDSVYITGTVRCKETDNPIPGINVSVKNNESEYDWNRTDKYGQFSFFIPLEVLSPYTLEFEDVDEEFNGGWFINKTEELEITKYRYYELEVYLDKKSEDPNEE